MTVFGRRLFWKVYLTLLASLVAVAVLMGTFWGMVGENPHDRWGAFHIRLDDLNVPARDGPPGAIAAAVDRLSEAISADVSVYSGDGTLIAAHGAPVALTARDGGGMGMRPGIMRIDLPDGRALLARLRLPGPRPGLRILTVVLIVAGGVALAAFPVTARLTRRLEALRLGVEGWGAGALSMRVDDAGHDEVAVVARAFNAAAARVEELLNSQKALLANASHELRSPLARLRIAVELWFAQPGAELKDEIVRNLAEIDQLVEEILLASRLDYGAPARAHGRVDLLGLAAEEAARFSACVEGMPEGGKPVEIEGDAILLRRLIRNLLENADRHGRPPVHVAVTCGGDKARIVVSDHGPGIAASERERVFEPFYRPAGRAESSGGWGLGLSLVRQIATRHGGDVRCEAEPGGGSRFVVELARGGRSGPL
ncbi:HAMP domain-containing sensor histidine kinase [Methylocapsa sp. S129]|uniref:sensor histidine kinase n=1 Tax=Methylocapsa sp. S129 TaxID=1641869 RepID=UPI00131BEA0D|nr:HAMP domain-containing sensor histidine kinase [Methylocapsa sp. S129]